MGAELAAEAGLAEAAERHLGADRAVRVDPHRARADRPRGAQRARHVAGPHAGAQPVPRVVGQRDRLVLGVERRDGHDRAEDLVAEDRHRRRDVGDDRRAHVVARALEPRRSGDDRARPRPPRARRARRRRRAARPTRAGRGRRRPPSRARRASRPRGACSRSTTLGLHRALDEQPRAGDARLPAVLERARQRALDRGVEVGVGEDDVRVLAAELERHALDRAPPPRP